MNALNILNKISHRVVSNKFDIYTILQDIESYLGANGGRDIRQEYDEMDTLTETKRHKLVNLLVDMLIERYGLYPSKLNKIMLAKAAIVLFPRFKVEGTEHGTVCQKSMAKCTIKLKIYYLVYVFNFIGNVLRFTE